MTIEEEALREWIAQQLRMRGHKQYTLDMVRNIRMGIDEGFRGTDVTPADEPTATLECEIKVSSHKLPWTDENGWKTHHEHVYNVAALIRECVELIDAIRRESA